MKPSMRKCIRLFCVLTPVVFLLGLTAFANSRPVAENPILGILEDLPGNYVGQSDVRAVRIVFRKRGSNWQAFPSECADEKCLKTLSLSYPSEIIWAITFRGKKLGNISARTRRTFDFYSDVGLQDIVSAGPVPTVGRKSNKYNAVLGSAVYRPLVATSGSFNGDPDSWQATPLPADLISSVRNEFRREFPRITNCKNPDENIAKPRIYADRNIAFKHVYSSRQHWFLAQTQLLPNRCDGPPGDQFIDQWFVITPRKEIHSIGEGMSLIDAGDYDNDGKSEIVFSIAGQDTSGYKIFYDDFKKHATFEFTYH